MNSELLRIGLSCYGIEAVPGAPDNLEIMQMAKDCGFNDYVHDSIAWCSLLMNWVALKAGLERSHSLAARSWLQVGTTVDTLEEADIVVFWRIDPSGPYGHVGMPIARRNGLIYVLGGNEGNRVQIEGFDPAKILGFKKLAAA